MIPLLRSISRRRAGSKAKLGSTVPSLTQPATLSSRSRWISRRSTSDSLESFRKSSAPPERSGITAIHRPAAGADSRGNLRVASAELSIKGLPSVVSDVNLDLQASSDEIRIAKATAKFAGGTLTLRGAAPIKQVLAGVVEAQISARGVHLAPAEGVSATVDADLTMA